ncbi:MOSC domain-containing protein [Paraburkholderia megapolitana]|uniref:MOSC domain-containing protein n=1 Tax=Paraburkholderia megapolitana TaxID=420953 RepID=UPI0038B6D237
MRLEVKELWRYPVKSMRGESLTTANVTKGGIAFDRGWAVRDEGARTIRGAKFLGELMQCSARYLSEQPDDGYSVPHAIITFPNGMEINTDDERIHTQLSELVNRHVTLWPLQPASNEDHYRINTLETGDLTSEIRKMFAIKDDEPLDLSQFPPDLVRKLTTFVVPPGTYFDALPINVLTEASIRHLQTLVPGVQLDVRRFRPNVLISDDADTTGLLEETWLGKSVQIGEVDLSIVMRCPRCVMVTREQFELKSEPSIMRSLVRHMGQCISVYGQIEVGGALQVGQSVVVDDTQTRSIQVD